MRVLAPALMSVCFVFLPPVRRRSAQSARERVLQACEILSARNDIGGQTI